MFYGWGLVCLKHRKWYEAQTSFNRATQLADARVPAWEASARTRLLQQNASAAMSTLLKMAPLLADKDNSMLTQAQKEAVGGWVGRAMFCVETNWRGLPTWRSVKKEIEQKDSKFEGLFHDKLWMAYENGRHGANKKAQAVEQRDESTPTPLRFTTRLGRRRRRATNCRTNRKGSAKPRRTSKNNSTTDSTRFRTAISSLRAATPSFRSGTSNLIGSSGTSRWSQPSRSWAAMAQSGWCRSRHRPTGRARGSKIHKCMQVIEGGKALLSTGYKSFVEDIQKEAERLDADSAALASFETHLRSVEGIIRSRLDAIVGSRETRNRNPILIGRMYPLGP